MKFLRFLLDLSVFLLSILLVRDSIFTHILPYMILAGTMCIFALLNVIQIISEFFYFLAPYYCTPTKFSYFLIFYIYNFVQSDSNSIYIIIAIAILLSLTSIIFNGCGTIDNLSYIFLTAILFNLYGSSENLMHHKLLLILNFILFGIIIVEYIIAKLYVLDIFNLSPHMPIGCTKLALILAMTVLFIISKVKVPETPLFFIIASSLALISDLFFKLLNYIYSE